MNAVDLYKLKNYRGNRIEYNRSKTEGVRDDKAFISIRIPKQAKPLLDKYIGKFSTKYKHFRGLDRALGKGSQKLAKMLSLPENRFYYARGSFATIARNKCKISKDDVALALNHNLPKNLHTDCKFRKRRFHHFFLKDRSIANQLRLNILPLLVKTKVLL